MNQTRTFLIVAWLMLAFLSWQAWQQDHATRTIAATTPSPEQPSVPGVPAPNLPPPDSVAGNVAEAPPVATSATPSTAVALPPVVISNDVLRLRIDPRGANVIGAELLAYAQTAARNSPPVKLLDDASSDFFVAESGLVSADKRAPDHLTVFQVEGGGGEKTMASGSDSVEQSLVWTEPSGVP